MIWLMVAMLSAQNVPEEPLPVHIGPYLQHPAADAMSVCLVSQTAKAVAIQVRPTHPQDKAPAPVPAEALKKRLAEAFSNGHPDARNRLQQTLRDWERLAKKPPSPRPS